MQSPAGALQCSSRRVESDSPRQPPASHERVATRTRGDPPGHVGAAGAGGSGAEGAAGAENGPGAEGATGGAKAVGAARAQRETSALVTQTVAARVPRTKAHAQETKGVPRPREARPRDPSRANGACCRAS